MTPALRHKTDPGIVFIDNDSAARVLHYGEDFLEEHLPVGTRVVYPPPPIRGLPNPRGAIRHALNHPLGCDPLYAQLRPGMRVTIALDDISLPLPPMATPDVRQTALEIVLEMLGDHGVDGRPPGHCELAAPEDDRIGNAPDGGAGHPQGVLSEPLLQPRCRGSERHGRAGKDPPSRAGPGEPAGDGERPHHLPEHQPGSHGRGSQVGDGGALRLREPEAPSRAADDPRFRRLHGSGQVGTEPQGGPDGKDRGSAPERVSRGDGAQQPDVLRRPLVPWQGRGRVQRSRPAEARGNALVAEPPARAGETAVPAPHPGRLRADRLLRGPHRTRSRKDPRTLLPAVRRPREGTVRHPALRDPLHLALQRELDPEPAPRPGHGAGGTCSTSTGANP